jgi:hypothetical protein
VEKTQYFEKHPEEWPDFDNISVNLLDKNNAFGSMMRLGRFRKEVYARFLQNALNAQRLGTLSAPERGVFDYCFVALRKLSDSEFVIPQQYNANLDLLQG